MFRTCAIKNYKRATKNRIGDKSVDECSTLRPEERTLPYFEVVPEQVLIDQRYLSLTSHQQGQFWRLMVHIIAPERGLVVKHAGVITKRLHLEKAEWEELERVFLKAGLLIEIGEGDYLLQYEFREQYLQTLESNNAKRRM